MPQLSLHSPLGPLTLSEEDGAIIALDWGWGRDQTETELLVAARAWLHAWFDKPEGAFPFPLKPEGTPYQKKVWEILLQIPTGEVRTYSSIASEAGGSPRSVGQAVGRNPIPILIPCHRVVAARSMGGYSGDGGIDDKIWLLEFEGARPVHPHMEPSGS
ncbi:methylated-DNA--[protein]-cysteine S-methyltransferase [Acetobacter oeni]|nr:methylated-DNA--[protein]-cysteine S-methyltransferase [Acetobacter oeni]NHO19025.1 methylated-DNA--[protein]-cysteine S-methyltransferase [Acetobacter oeni]GBR09311.1 O6-methylguanine-DNA methyltransferase [Acetobacter oeni LMG 21952]